MAPAVPVRDRSAVSLMWYRAVQYVVAIMTTVVMRWRATGRGIYRRRERRELPRAG